MSKSVRGLAVGGNKLEQRVWCDGSWCNWKPSRWRPDQIIAFKRDSTLVGVTYALNNQGTRFIEYRRIND